MRAAHNKHSRCLRRGTIGSSAQIYGTNVGQGCQETVASLWGAARLCSSNQADLRGTAAQDLRIRFSFERVTCPRRDWLYIRRHVVAALFSHCNRLSNTRLSGQDGIRLPRSAAILPRNSTQAGARAQAVSSLDSKPT